MVSTSCWRRRLPVCLLTCRNETRSFLATAGYKAIGQDTRESFKKPFQYARGTNAITPTDQTRTPIKWSFRPAFLSPLSPSGVFF